MSQASTADRKNYIYNIIIIVMSAILVVICLTIGFLFWQRSKADNNATQNAGSSVSTGAQTQQGTASGTESTGNTTPTSTTAPASGQIAIPSYSSITVKANTTTIDVPFRNPDVNTVYLVFTLTLDDGTELYKSNYVTPGQSVEVATLTKPLSAGTYTGKLKYETFTMDDYSQRNGTELPITIVAE